MKEKLYKTMIFLIFSAPTFGYESIIFSPEKNIEVKMTINKSKATYLIESKSKNTEKEIEFETEKPLSISIGDYNFDGHKDFAIFHADDGMGTFTVYRIFIYSTKSQDFEEITPDCGDQFLNLKIQNKKKILVSTYYEENVPKLCETHLSKESR